MGERLTYGILACYRVVLVERLGGLFFAGRRSCKRVHETGSEIRAVAHPGTIEPSVNKGFPTRSGKSLKLEISIVE